MENEPLTWRCSCGAFEARVMPVKGTRCVCYCRDCQAFLAHLERSDIADAAGGTDLFQTMPDRVQVVKGADHLAALRLSDKGPIRWYADCCDTPICNTGASRTVPLASFLVDFFDRPEATGPIVARVNRKGARGQIEGDAGNVKRFIARFLGGAALALLTGRYRRTPFFDGSGRPVAEPKRLTDEERDRAYRG